MVLGLGAVCDDFYISSRLFLKMEMALERETVLHFFDRIRKEYPGLTKLRRREDGAILLEEDTEVENASRRWVRLDRSALRFGHFAPTTTEEVRRFGELLFTQAPYHLSFSDIDYDHLEVVYGFDLAYRGNHDHLVAQTLLSDQGAGSFLFGEESAHVIDAQPYYGIALSPDCDLQAYAEVKSRTGTYEIRQDHYETQPISVLLTLRKYWGVDPPKTLDGALSTLFDRSDELATDRIIPGFVNPLAAAIASRP